MNIYGQHWTRTLWHPMMKWKVSSRLSLWVWFVAHRCCYGSSGVAYFTHFQVFLVGLYCGLTEPCIVGGHLEDRIRDLRILLSNGIFLRWAVKRSTFILSRIIEDAPAKVLIKQIKGHSGHYRLSRWTIGGSGLAGHLVIPVIPGWSRSGADFRSRGEQDHMSRRIVFQFYRMNRVRKIRNFHRPKYNCGTILSLA